ncbi:hypothetical protein L8T82_07705, partial [Campylobacter sp. IFREMER_LSEM_CL292]|uniref:hypothetical protein n=1 Tax=Campylobacter sp. IFREMER_LSEM_CL292 TaxID=2911623 RepID=UPI0021E80D6D
MSLDVKRFLDNYINGENLFKVLPYETTGKNTEVEKLYGYIKNIDLDSIVEFWKAQDKRKFLELQHPLYDNIITRAVFSKYGHIFFIDKNNRHPWLLWQRVNVIDCILVDNKIYTFPLCPQHSIDFEIFNTVEIDKLLFQDIPFYFCLGSSNAYWHFFFEEIANLYAIFPQKGIVEVSDKLLFSPKKIFKINSKNNIAVNPRIISSSTLINYKKNDIFCNMGREIYKECLASCELIEDRSHFELVLWFGLTTRNDGNKTWLNQVDCIVMIISFLSHHFKNIKVYLDGVRSYEDKKNYKSTFNASIIIDVIKAQLSHINNIIIVSLDGTTIREAVCCCSEVDLAITEAGSSSMIPSLCCNVPSILYGNYNYLRRISRMYANNKSKCIDKEFVTCVEDLSKKTPGNYNYYISEFGLYNVVCDYLKNIKNIEIQKFSAMNFYGHINNYIQL